MSALGTSILNPKAVAEEAKRLTPRQLEALTKLQPGGAAELQLVELSTALHLLRLRGLVRIDMASGWTLTHPGAQVLEHVQAANWPGEEVEPAGPPPKVGIQPGEVVILPGMAEKPRKAPHQFTATGIEFRPPTNTKDGHFVVWLFNVTADCGSGPVRVDVSGRTMGRVSIARRKEAEATVAAFKWSPPERVRTAALNDFRDDSFAECGAEVFLKASKLARGVYQQNLLCGRESWSGNTLRGRAKRYGASYATSRGKLLSALKAAGIHCVMLRAHNGRIVARIG